VDVKDLAGIPLFEGLSKRELERIASWADVVDVPEGFHLLNQGSFPHEFFVVLDGTVAVDRFGKRLAELSRGDFFGEIALLEHERRTATVMASSPLRAMVMGTREFDEMRAELPEVARRLREIAEERHSR
jgi:CRP/FNR family transcriptional regulator, cyclic AMP receptor protein